MAAICALVATSLAIYVRVFMRNDFYTPTERAAGLAYLAAGLLVAVLGVGTRRYLLPLTFWASCSLYLALTLGPGSETPDEFPTSRLAEPAFDHFYTDSVIRREAAEEKILFLYTPEYNRIRYNLYSHFMRSYHLVFGLLSGVVAALMAWSVGRSMSRRAGPACVAGCFASLVCLLATAAAEAGDDVAPPETFEDYQKAHWAYQVPERPEPPAVRDGAWVRNPIDRFILKALEEVDFRPTPGADRVDLIRRVTYDLTGLPPTPEEVDAFLADESPDAYEAVVDRLLDSPQFGERQAQHWLDLAHYADSNGFELDAERPDAWRYRDWVVKAFNDDMPYDQFVTLQLAGDEARPGDPEGLVATGFGRSGPREIVGGNIDPEVRRQSELTEIATTVGSVFLGLTVGCARCHDHKFDALPTTDYYRLQAFFAAAQLVEPAIADDGAGAAFEAAKAAVAERVEPLKARLAALERPYREALAAGKRAALTEAERAVLAIPEGERSPIQKKMAEGAKKALNVTWEELAAAVAADPEDHVAREGLRRAIHEIESALPRPPAHAMALIEQGGEVPDSFVLRRGDPKSKGAKVLPRPPGIVLAAMADDAFPAIEPTGASTGRRLALARWLTRPDNPLTARVIVNRLWQTHLGRGIVGTPSDFGVRGDPPSHPELLDWLACELVAQGWHLKPIHRLIVTSATYRQSSRRADPSQVADDPENLMVARGVRRRRDAEAIRDAMLAVSGELNPRAGGPGVLVPIEPEVEALIFTEAEVVDLWPVDPDPRQHARRSLYLFRKRNVRNPLLDAFDAPDTQTPCPRRGVSTHALQPLILLNGPFALGRASAFARRLAREAPDDPARVARAYRLTLSRPPTAAETAQALAFLDAQADFLRTEDDSLSPDDARAGAWTDFAQAMLNRNDFIYIP